MDPNKVDENSSTLGSAEETRPKSGSSRDRESSCLSRKLPESKPTLKTDRTLVVENSTVGNSGCPASPDVETIYLVPVLGTNKKGDGDVRRVSRVFGTHLSPAVLERDELVRAVNKITPSRRVEKRSSTNVDRRNLLPSHVGERGFDLYSIAKTRNRKRAKKDDDFDIRWNKKLSDKCDGAHVMPPTMARRLVGISREIGPVQLKGSKIIVGMYPSRVPPFVRNTRKCIYSGKRIGDEELHSVKMVNTIAEVNTNVPIAKEVVGSRTNRRRNLVSNDIASGVNVLIKAACDRVEAQSGLMKDIVLHGTVPVSNSIGIVCTLPTTGSIRRSIGVAIYSNASEQHVHRRVACVQLMVNESTLGDRLISVRDLIIKCSCGKGRNLRAVYKKKYVPGLQTPFCTSLTHLQFCIVQHLIKIGEAC